MSKFRTQLTFLILCVALSLGCGGEKDPAAGGAAAGKAAAVGGEEANEAPAGPTPDGLGATIAGEWSSAMKEVVKLTADRPAVAEVKPKLEALHEATVTKLVALGKTHASFSADDQRKVQGKLMMVQREEFPPDLFQAFSDTVQHYMKEDNATGNLISSFNVITQYAFYDLLKKQLPKEAQRLGIK